MVGTLASDHAAMLINSALLTTSFKVDQTRPVLVRAVMHLSYEYLSFKAKQYLEPPRTA